MEGNKAIAGYRWRQRTDAQHIMVTRRNISGIESARLQCKSGAKCVFYVLKLLGIASPGLRWTGV
jgi:hypothetical protein